MAVVLPQPLVVVVQLVAHRLSVQRATSSPRQNRDDGQHGCFAVTFNNTSTANQHNWVLVKGGDDVAARVDEAASAVGPEGGYLPTTPDVVAGGKQLDPGGNESINIPALPAGAYTYICTTPGHYAAGMKGTLTIQ